MRLFFKKILLLSAPVLLIVACYLITDPYKKLWKYELYTCNYIMLNRGDVSTRVYLNNKSKYNYDSFIFGSSRSTAHTSREWSNYLSGGNMPYSYGSWSESIKGIYKKLALLDSLNSRINNVFIIVDDHTFTSYYSKDISSYDHYLISGESRLQYHLRSFLHYLTDPLLIVTSVDYKIFHKKRFYMKGFIDMTNDDLDEVTNDWMVNSEKEILSDSAHFYGSCKNKFYTRSRTQEFYKKQISEEEKIYLLKIKKILDNHKSDCKIVIAPLYNQKKFNPVDLSILYSVFHVENVFDYSGINEITNDYHNYSSDVLHYRKKVGNLIFKEIYNGNTNYQQSTGLNTFNQLYSAD